MHIYRYTADKQEQWDRFVRTSNNGNLFHYRNFLSYHIGRTFDDHSLIFEKNGHIVALFPAAVVERNGEKVLHSHPGASFGGFVFKNPYYSEVEEIIDSFEEYCISNGFDSTFFIPTPFSYFKDQNETFEYALIWRGYQIIEHYIFSIIDLKGSLDGIYREIFRRKKRSKSYYRRLIKENNIRFEWNKNFDEFYPILVENKARHGIKPTHTLDEITKLDKLFPGYFNLLMMYSGDVPVGGTLNFTANDRVAIIFYNMINYEYAHLQPASLQVLESIKWGKKMGFDILDFGVSQLPEAPDPLTPSHSLIRFKEQLNSKGMIRKVFEKKFCTAVKNKQLNKN